MKGFLKWFAGVLVTLAILGGIIFGCVWAYQHTARVTVSSYDSSYRVIGHHGYRTKDYVITYNDDGTVTVEVTFWNPKEQNAN